MKTQITPAFFILMLCLAWEAGAGDLTTFSRQGVMSGYPVSVTVWAQDAQFGESALDIAFREVERLHQRYSPKRQGSVVNQLNQFAGERPVLIDAETLKLLQWAVRISKKTRGVFDITTASYKWQYGFEQEVYQIPNDLRLQQINPLVNYAYLDLYPRDMTILYKRQGVQIDLSDLLFNYTLNQLQRSLKSQAVAAAICSVGENRTVVGQHPQDRVWALPIWQPGEPRVRLETAVLKAGKLLSASVYDRSFVKDGKRVHAYLDAKTGKPASYNLGVTLYLADQPKLDLPAAVLMLLPAPEGVKLVERLSGAECLIIDQDRKVWKSKGWDKTLAVEIP